MKSNPRVAQYDQTDSPNLNAADIQAAVSDRARLKAVKDSGFLNTAPEAVFDELTAQASRRLNAPLAVLTLVDEYRDYVKSQVGLPDPMAANQEILDSPSFCQMTIAQNEPVVINDTTRAPLYGLFPSVKNSHVRAHMGIPLTINGQPVGNIG